MFANHINEVKKKTFSFKHFRIKEVGFRIKGHMTIFNQEFTNKRSRFRDGSVNDVEYLSATFKRFGMEPDIKPDLKFHEIVNEIHACK